MCNQRRVSQQQGVYPATLRGTMCRSLWLQCQVHILYIYLNISKRFTVHTFSEYKLLFCYISALSVRMRKGSCCTGKYFKDFNKIFIILDVRL